MLTTSLTIHGVRQTNKKSQRPPGTATVTVVEPLPQPLQPLKPWQRVKGRAPLEPSFVADTTEYQPTPRTMHRANHPSGTVVHLGNTAVGVVDPRKRRKVNSSSSEQQQALSPRSSSAAECTPTPTPIRPTLPPLEVGRAQRLSTSIGGAKSSPHLSSVRSSGVRGTALLSDRSSPRTPSPQNSSRLMVSSRATTRAASVEWHGASGATADRFD